MNKGCIQFDGTTNSGVETQVGLPPAVAPLTVIGFVKLLASVADQVVWQMRPSGAGSQPELAQVSSSATNLIMYGGTNSLTTSFQLNLGSWYSFVILVFPALGSLPAGIELFVQPVGLRRLISHGVDINPPTFTPNRICMGFEHLTAGGGGGWMTGGLRSVRAWNAILSKSESAREVRSLVPLRKANLIGDHRLSHRGDLVDRYGRMNLSSAGGTLATGDGPSVAADPADDLLQILTEINGASWIPGTAYQPPVARRRIDTSGSSAPLLSLASAPIPAESWASQAAAAPARSLARRNSDMGGSAAPLLALAAAAGANLASWQGSAGTAARAPAMQRQSGHSTPALVPISSQVPMTWVGASPVRLSSSSWSESGGAGPLMPDSFSWWDPESPPVVKRRPIALPDPSVLAIMPRPLANLGWAVEAPGARLRRPYVLPEALGPAQAIQQAVNLSWALQSFYRTARPVAYGSEASVPQLLGTADLSWAQPAYVVIRRGPKPGSHGDWSPLSAGPAVDISWAQQAQDSRSRAAKFDDRGGGYPITGMATVVDLSWLSGSPDRARRRTAVIVDHSFVPKATAVILSPWGWISESAHARKAIRVVDSTPVSALVPPAILTTLVQGWIPSLPDHMGRRISRVNAHRDQEPIAAITMQALGWLGESPTPRQSRARADGGSADIAPLVVSAPLGWFQDAARQGLVRARAGGGFEVHPILAQSMAQGWQAQDATRAHQKQRLSHQDAGPPLFAASALPSYWQHWQVQPRPPGPVAPGAHETPLLTLVPATLPPMPTMDLDFVVVASRSALRAALLNGEASIVLGGSLTIGDLHAVLREVGGWRAILRS